MENQDSAKLTEARQREITEKQQRIQAFIEQNSLDGLALNTHNYFAWATAGGSNWVATDNNSGVATLVYLANGQRYAFANNIEIPRLENEELLSTLGFQVISQGWWSSQAEKDATLWDVVGGKTKKLGTDWNLDGAELVSGKLAPVRFSLTPDEVNRYRQLGADAGEALENVCANLTPGLSEWEIASRLAQAVLERGMLATVNLVATDERIFKYRHPIPTHKKLEKYAMVVLCAKRGGLIASCTRLVHFGSLSEELKRKQEAVLQVDATFNLNTRPGLHISNIFKLAQATYAKTGFADEWQLHHQGGATGYSGRDYFATPSSAEVVQENQAFAWNPSITGVKVEDTVLVSSERVPEVLTHSANSSWPTAPVEVEGLGQFARPLILEK